ncbi:hypothetical protein ACJ4V0_15190 [Phreatobacter sp. HK31-P]
MKRSDQVRQLLGSLDAVRMQAGAEGLETMRYLLDMAHAEGSIALAKIVYAEEDEKSRIGTAESLRAPASAPPAAAAAGGS